MNERINELLIEAHKQTNGGIYNGHLSEWTAKFAELIVRECAKSADEWYQNHNDIQWDPAQHIKNHFGVEE